MDRGFLFSPLLLWIPSPSFSSLPFALGGEPVLLSFPLPSGGFGQWGALVKEQREGGECWLDICFRESFPVRLIQCLSSEASGLPKAFSLLDLPLQIQRPLLPLRGCALWRVTLFSVFAYVWSGDNYNGSLLGELLCELYLLMCVETWQSILLFFICLKYLINCKWEWVLV